MLKDACDVRDKVHTLLLEGEDEAALVVAQILTVLCEDEDEFDKSLQHMLDVALNATQLVHGPHPERRVNVHRTSLTSDQQVRICNGVAELRQLRQHNKAALAVTV